MPKRYSEPEFLGNVTIYMNENSEKTQLFFSKNLTSICSVFHSATSVTGITLITLTNYDV